MPLCTTCYGQAQKTDAQCPRYNTDLNAWRRESTYLLHAYAIPVIVLALVAATILALLLSFKVANAFLPFFPSVFVALGLCASWYAIWQEAWVRQVRPSWRPSVIHWIIATMLLALLFGAVALVLEHRWDGAELEMVRKLALLGLVSLACMCLTVSLTLVVIQSYISDLKERVPQPIFVDIKKLSAIVQRTAGEQVGGKTLEVLATERAKDGRVWLQVGECRGRVVLPNLSSGGKLESGSITLPSWIVRADRWGRVRSMRPHGGAV